MATSQLKFLYGRIRITTSILHILLIEFNLHWTQNISLILDFKSQTSIRQ